jgi:hypothetical protein
MRRSAIVALAALAVVGGCGSSSKPPLEQVHAAAQATLAAGTARMQWRNGARGATGIVDFARNRGRVHYVGALGDTRDLLLLGNAAWVRRPGGQWQRTHERDPLQVLVSAPRQCASARSARKTGDGDFAIGGGTICRVDAGKLVAVARRGVVAYYDFGKPKPIDYVSPR